MAVQVQALQRAEVLRILSGAEAVERAGDCSCFE